MVTTNPGTLRSPRYRQRPTCDGKLATQRPIRPLDTIGSTRSTTIATPADAIEARPALPIYLTPKKVARMLKVNERTVLRWAAEDPSMPTIRIGRVIRWEQDALFRWLAKKRPRKSMS